ncbi:MAG TPA: hypothetical protein VM935_04830, partial [Chitinophagaceae bacterium]|nr:hypothetical protein [Chitinophagaceae bacterium]
MDFESYKEKWNNWELWPFWMRYINILPAWVWYCFRSRAVWFFTPSNPTLTFGGFEGEDKKEMYTLLQEGSYPKTIYISPGESFEEVKEKISAHQFS